MTLAILSYFAKVRWMQFYKISGPLWRINFLSLWYIIRPSQWGQKFFGVVLGFCIHIITNTNIKPSISSQSKPCTMTCIRLLKCFVLNTLFSKTKHLRSLVQVIVRGFDWPEILGLSNFKILVAFSEYMNFDL